MITFEQTRALSAGDVLYEHMGWGDGGKVTSIIAWQVVKVHANSLDVVCPSRVWNRNARLRRSDFPMQYWSIDDPRLHTSS